MKISRWFAILAFAGAILAFVGLSPSTAKADSLPPDPGVKLCCGGGSTVLTSPDDPNFVLNVLGGQVNTFDFINSIGQTATGLNLLLTNETNGGVSVPFDLIFTCDNSNDPYFANCSPESPTQTTLISFFGLPGQAFPHYNGIPNAPADTISCDDTCTTTTAGADFEITVDATDISAGKNFTLKGTLLVPEPSTVLLVLVGVISLFAFRRAGWVPKLT